MKKYFFLFFVVINLPVAFSQFDSFEKSFFTERTNDYNREEIALASANTGNYDLKHYTFELEADPKISYIKGKVTPLFEILEDNVESIFFDFNSIMKVDAVKYHGENVNYEFTGNYELKIELPVKLQKGSLDSLSIWYQGNPSSSGFGSFETSQQYCDFNKPLMWTLSEPYGARDWWPTKQTLNDKIDSVDMIITTPKAYTVASNGLLVSKEIIGENAVFHWKHRYPEPAYLIAFAISEYEEYIDWVPFENGDSLMVQEFVFDCDLEYCKENSPNIVPMMQLFSKLFGEYPFYKEKYGHAVFGWGGGMEHSSMTFVSSFNYGLIAHELGHQWFGDKVTCGSWQDIWLNEGFATYLEGLTYQFLDKPNSWENWKGKNLSRATSTNYGNKSVFVRDTSSVSRIFNSSLSYSKGAYVLHMLRWKLGDDDFFQGVRNYLNDEKLAYSYARTKDLKEHLEAQSGQDLNEFFEDWIYGKGFPSYNILWWHKADGKIVIEITQTQYDNSVDYFEMPIPILVKGENKDTLLVLDNTHDAQRFTFDLDFEGKSIEADPDKWICGNFSEPVYLDVLDIENPNTLRVYPNPSSGYVKVALDNEKTIHQAQILNASGKVIASKKANNKNFVDFQNLKPGVYFVRVLSESNVLVEKFVVN